MILVSIYVSAIVLANLSVAHFGPWVSPINAFLFIGLDLSLRDLIHDKWEGDRLWLRMGALILIAGLISYALNPASGRIAMASMIAFCVSGLIDTIVYRVLRNRPYLQRSNASNGVAAVADSLIFPTIAFGSFMPIIVALQIAAKLSGGFIWSFVINHVRKSGN